MLYGALELRPTVKRRDGAHHSLVADLLAMSDQPKYESIDPFNRMDFEQRMATIRLLFAYHMESVSTLELI